MKIFSVISVGIIGLLGFGQVNQYQIKGNIAGQAEGMKVYLQTATYPESKIVDSTVIRNGKFIFNGKLDGPAKYSVIIDKTPKGQKSSERNWLRSSFYLENAVINYSGHIDSLPGYYFSSKKVVRKPVITGSANQDLQLKYEADLKELNTEKSRLYELYMKEYHMPSLSGTFNTKEGIALVNQINTLDKEIKVASFDFLLKHLGTVFAYDKVFENFQGMYVSLTVDEIDQLVGFMEKEWKGTKKMDEFKEVARIAKKTAIGVKYQDLQLTDLNGNKVNLSKYIKKGEYVMLEFWASWCGPCRAEIPHIKHVNEKYKNKGFKILSISIDEREQDWKKAMKEEGMDWIQLNDRLGFKGTACKTYNIGGVPYCLLLDKEGRIMKTEMRGAYLDAALEEIFKDQNL